jgi:flagellar basal body-associated protein FliL
MYGEESQDRKPAQLYDYEERPVYYNQNKKLIKIANVKVPLMVHSVNDMDNIVIDFSILCSNRFTRLYLNEHDYELRDHLFVSFEPIDPDFTVDEEGKWILKEKLKDEINMFLEERNVEGYVEDVHIIDILGT